MKMTNDIHYVGVNDHHIDLFEGQYHVPHGMAYNSYVILDEKNLPYSGGFSKDTKFFPEMTGIGRNFQYRQISFSTCGGKRRKPKNPFLLKK